METLWERAPQTASEVACGLRGSTGWAENTVRTLLSRLVGKNVLTTQPNAAGVKTFAPAVRREDCVRKESSSFLQRVFRGSAQPLLAHFAENARLSAAEVEDLKRLLDESLKQNRNPKR